MPSLNIVADAHIWGAKSAFSSLPGIDVHLNLLETGEITPASVKNADILLTRSSTRVNKGLLAGSSVRFAATATIGDDHYDKEYLENHGIAFANAAGSSTGSVIEYMITVLLELHHRGVLNLPETRLGIIGAGRIGGGLGHICRRLNMQIMLNDPPRARIEGGSDFSRLDTLLEEADVLTLHTPLIDHGEDCTLHLLDSKRIARFQGRGIINAARGGCADNEALADWLDGNPSRFAVIDCWEHEPHIMHRLLGHPRVIIATPHIAGHSIEGKAANTQFVYNALCNWLGLPPCWNMDEHFPPTVPAIEIRCTGDVWHDLHKAASALYPVILDNDAIRSWQTLPDHKFAAAFTGYRRHYPARRAWSNVPVRFVHPSAKTVRLANAMKMNILSS